MNCPICDSEMTLKNEAYPGASYWFCFAYGSDRQPTVFERRGVSLAEVQEIMERVA